MRGMLNGPHAADVLHRVVVRVVQAQSARRAAVAQVTVAAQAVRAEAEAVSAHRQARHAVVRLRERLAHDHARVVVAREVASQPSAACPASGPSMQPTPLSSIPPPMPAAE